MISTPNYNIPFIPTGGTQIFRIESDGVDIRYYFDGTLLDTVAYSIPTYDAIAFLGDSSGGSVGVIERIVVSDDMNYGRPFWGNRVFCTEVDL